MISISEPKISTSGPKKRTLKNVRYAFLSALGSPEVLIFGPETYYRYLELSRDFRNLTFRHMLQKLPKVSFPFMFSFLYIFLKKERIF